MMARTGIFLTLLLLSGIISAADLVVRSSVEPEEAWVGQRVTLNIDVLSDAGWAQIEKINELDIPGAYVMRTESQGTRLQETINGTSYSGQRYQLSIYPQAAGAIQVPAMPVNVRIKAWGAEASSESRRATVPAVNIISDAPKGADNIPGLVSTTEYTAEQSWEPELTTPKVGDAIKRIIRMQATDVSGMAFAPLTQDKIRGVGIYPSEPEVNDSTNRGSLNGTRKEAITYVFEGSGKVTLPDIDLYWWNIDQPELKKISLPGKQFTVVAGDQAPGSKTIKSAMVDFPAGNYWQIVIVLLLTLLLLLYAGKWLLQRWLRRRRESAYSEETYFRLMIKAIKSKKAVVVLREVMRWLDRINHADQPAEMDVFIARYGDEAARKVACRLVESALRNERLAETEQLIAALSAARDRWLSQQSAHQKQKEVSLPELNPA